MKKILIVLLIGILFTSLCTQKETSTTIGGGGTGGGGGGLSPPACTPSCASCVQSSSTSCTGTQSCTNSDCSTHSQSCNANSGTSCKTTGYGSCILPSGQCGTGSKSITNYACNETGSCVSSSNSQACTVDCPSGQSCNITTNSCYTPLSCSGSMLLNLTPSTVELGGLVTPSGSGLNNCASKVIYFKNDSCIGTEVSSCILTNGNCTGNSFTSPSIEGLYTYYACIDKNSDGDFTDSGESSSKTLNVSVPKVTDLWLHTDGKYIKNSQGNIIVLHGVNYDQYSFIKAIWSGKYAYHTEADYQRIAGWGFNVVRWGMSWQYLEPIPENYNTTYLDYIDRDIQWAKNNGIHIILPFHQWFWSPYFDNLKAGAYGFPEWLFSGYNTTEEGRTQSQQDFWLGKGPNGTVATPENPSMQDRMISAWKYLAERYKDEPTIIGYDLFNEPPGGSLGTDVAASYLQSFYERLIDNITSVDNNHIFIYEPIGGKWYISPFLLNRPNVIFSVHFYPQDNDATHWPGYFGGITVLDNQIKGYLDLPASNPSRSWNIPIAAWEFGPSTTPLYQNRYGWVNDMADTCNKYNLHWTYYSYCVLNQSNSGCEFSILNPDGTEIKAIADAVDKPYPRVSSIPPSEFSFNSITRHFRVVFSGVDTVKTQIYVPYRYYPTLTVNSNSSSWSQVWNSTSRMLTVTAVMNGPTEITVDNT
ncbi:MAG: cellulase family glycosylhydrolase [Candidatus Aenigmatarchaeota archaeon]